MMSTEKKSIAPLFSKNHVTVLVADSGLGGLAIFGEIAAGLREKPIFPKASLIYFNAWPEQKRGYNRFEDMAARVRVFDAALAGMARYRPDVILIACNTLSVLYPRTAFSREPAVPVIDIVHFGVDMLFNHLSDNAGSAAVLLGTVTTIASDVHRSRLMQKGVSPHRLVPQACDQLATRIEKGPGSDPVLRMIDQFTGQAAEKLDGEPRRVFAALLCTHFGYCRDLFKEKLEEKTKRPVTVLDPNRLMASFLFDAAGDRRCGNTAVDLQVVSRIYWETSKIQAISGAVKAQSPEAAAALIHYRQLPDLFTF